MASPVGGAGVPPAPVELQIAIEAEGWDDADALHALCDRVLGAAAACLAAQTDQPMPSEPPELSLLFTDDEAMRKINARWRDKDAATNVLSFPAVPLVPGRMPAPMLGDIVFARETIAREAKEGRRSFQDHLAHLVVHGYLHLFGYDHVEPADAEVMEGLETRILATLGISDPYGHTEPVEPLMRR